MRHWSKHAAVVTVLLGMMSMFSIAHGEEDALNPRAQGDWNHENAPLPTYRQNCHPAMPVCQLPVRPITKKESDVNQRAISGKRIGTPSPPVPLKEDALVGRKIGTMSSLNESSARSGPAIKDRR